jgi:hypothetical protein
MWGEQLKASGATSFQPTSFHLVAQAAQICAQHARQEYLIKPVSQACLLQVITQDGMNVKTFSWWMI